MIDKESRLLRIFLEDSEAILSGLHRWLARDRLNVVIGEFGFPSEIEDPTILEVARGDNGIEDQVEED